MRKAAIEGRLVAEGFRFALVISRFNGLITERLVDGAMDCLVRHGASEDDIELIRVPGTWEMPVAVRWILERGGVDAVIAIGCVIRGGTPHFEYVAGEVTKGLARLQVDYAVPVTLGVLTTDTIDQAVERAGTKHGNKGFEASLAAIEMVGLSRAFSTNRGQRSEPAANSAERSEAAGRRDSLPPGTDDPAPPGSLAAEEVR